MEYKEMWFKDYKYQIANNTNIQLNENRISDAAYRVSVANYLFFFWRVTCLEIIYTGIYRMSRNPSFYPGVPGHSWELPQFPRENIYLFIVSKWTLIFVFLLVSHYLALFQCQFSYAILVSFLYLLIRYVLLFLHLIMCFYC